MVGFLNAHGTNPNIFDGQFQDLDFGLADDVASDDRREVLEWVSVEELIGTHDEPVAPERFDADLELTIWSTPLLGADYDWYSAEIEDDYCGIAVRIDGSVFLHEDYPVNANDDSYLPSFSSNIEQRQPLTWTEIELRSRWNKYPWRSHNCGRKPAKFRIDGKRDRKDNRDHRIGNRQKFAGLLDYWADREMTMWDIYLEGDRDPIIPQFDIEIVGLTDDEASSYEAEYQRDRADYIRELEAAEWDDSFEDDDSLLFKSVTYTDQLVEIHERHLFPERFETYRPYRYSSQDYYDDYGMDLFEPEWDCGPDYDERDDLLDIEEIDFGPTLEEWVELDSIAFERMLEEDAESFSPRFVGSRRSTLREHISEPRRGKLKRKYGKSTSFLYRGGRPYTAPVATH